MVKKGTLIISTIVLSAFLFGTFGGVVGQQTAADQDQIDAIKADQGETAPFGTWAKHLERQILYLHSDDPMPTNEAGVTQVPVGVQGYSDYERPANALEGNAAEIHQDTNYKRFETDWLDGTDGWFPLVTTADPDAPPEEAGLQADMRIYGLDGYMKATCDNVGGGGQGIVGIDVLLHRLDWDGDSWEIHNHGSGSDIEPLTSFTLSSAGTPSTTTGMQTFTGDTSTGNPAFDNGWLMPAGSRPAIQVIASLGSKCIVSFDTEQTEDFALGSASRIEFIADASRYNTWTERMGGDFAPGLPSADEASDSSRQFQVQVSHVNTWPNVNAFHKDAADPFNYQDRGYSASRLNTDPDGSDFHISNDHNTWIRVRNTDTDTLYFDERTDNPSTLNFPDIRPLEPVREVQVLEGVGNGTHAVNQVTYTFQYSRNLPDGKYQPEIYSENFGISIGPMVTVGLKAFDIEPLDGLTHEINAGESTLFRIAVSNTGGDTDTYTLQHGTVGAGWTITPVTQRATVGPGNAAELSVRVTAPTQATLDTDMPFTLTVSSASPTEVPSQSVTGHVVIVDEEINNANANATLLGGPGDLEIFPGQQLDLAGLRIHNKAAFQDTYVFSAVIPSDVDGFTTKVTPPSRTISAASIEDLSLTLRATQSVQEGQSFTLNIHATRLGATAPESTISIPVEVVITRALELASIVAEPEDGQPMRTDGTDTCATTFLVLCVDGHTDNDHDKTAVFRVAVTNPGSLPDTYRLRGYWSEGKDTYRGSGSCDDDGGRYDHPDFWRMNFGGIDATAQAPSDQGSKRATHRVDWGTVTVPAGETVYRYIQIGWVPGYDPDTYCDGTDPPSDQVTYDMRLQSVNDPTVVESIKVRVDRVGAGAHEGDGIYGGGTHDVAILPDLLDGVPQSRDGSANQRASGNAYDPADYYFRVVNLGNEDDNLIVDAAGLEDDDWSQRITHIENTDASGQGNNTSSVDCTETVDDTRWRCTMGIGDEATFRLRVRPPDGERVNRQVESALAVTSGDDAEIKDELIFITKTLGRFSFEASTLKEKRLATPGSDVSLPFKIDNTGTQGDQYTISILSGDANWKPRISSSQEVFIPGQHSQTGFVMVTVPEGVDGTADPSVSRNFAVEIDSVGAGVRQLFFEVEVIPADELTVDGEPSNSVLLAQRGAPNQVTVVARTENGEDASGDPLDVVFEVDDAALPEGWTVAQDTATATFAEDGSAFRATAEFDVTPPTDALATSRVPLLVTATTQEDEQDDRRTASRDVILNLEADAGIGLSAVNDNPQTILPGGTATFEVDILNDALAQDTVDLSATQLPGGWSYSFAPAEIALGPLETDTLQVTVNAPTTAEPGDNVTLALFGTSRNDPTIFESLELWSIVGFTQLNATVAAPVQTVEPDATATYVLKVANEGNIVDRVSISSEVLTSTLAGDVTVQASPRTVQIAPNSSADITLRFATSTRVPPGATIVVNVTALSLDNPATSPVADTVEIRGIVLDYKARDVDGDSIKEYALDSNLDASDGFESFRESRTPGGRSSRPAALERTLSDEGRQQFMLQVTDPATGNTTEVLYLFIDGDQDGRADHFIDTSGDGLPNAYWDPDGNHSMPLSVFKDVDADNVVDYFVDASGDGALDRVFNVVTGRFTDLIVRDIDGDGTTDYGVDANGNGQVDADETVLFTRGGQLIAVQKVDVDGDGKLDEVYDYNGDGKPDTFIRAGETAPRKITLKDVNGDGVEDWVYDANLDGKDDTYYDPVTKQGGQRIDSQASFLRMAGEYWYIPALFVLVLVLFVVLLAVTRR